jgi:predicted phage tail protein
VLTGQTALITWTPPANGSVPQAYQLVAGSASGLADLAVLQLSATPPALLASGVPLGTYYLRVQSLTAAGASGPSNEVAAVVKATCTAPPPAPTNVRATVAGQQVTIEWNLASTSDGPTAFSIDVGSASGLSNLLVVPVPYTQRSLTAVAPPGTYYIRMRSHNGCGSSASSNEIVLQF